jgi:hypothetical protein
VEGKRNDVGLRFVLDPNAGDGSFLLWNTEVIPALIDRNPRAFMPERSQTTAIHGFNGKSD